MKLLGIPLRRPGFDELTAAAVMATGLWVAAVGVLHLLHWQLGKVDAGALLLVMFWGCVSARLGISIGMGQRHLAANLLVSGLLLGVYQAAWAIAS
jgi:hypothetical protein